MQCDVVVIGAGPGGSAAAYWLARAGADVLLVDRAHFPRDKPCGDGLTPRAVGLLASMGLPHTVLERGRAFTGIRTFGPKGDAARIDLGSSNERAAGLVIPRRDLDDALRQRAVAAGARFRPGFAAQAPYRREGRLLGLQGWCDGHLLTIKARLIIVATGANRALLRALGLWHSDRLRALAMRAYVTNLDGLDSNVEVYLNREILPGYAWIFPLGDETANVGVGLRLVGDMSPAEGNRRLRATFDRFMHSERLTEGQLPHRPRGFPLRTDFPAVPTYAPGVLVVGETAGLVNPLTGEGIAWALESGKLAAEVAGEALQSDDLSGEKLRCYDALLRERYAGYFEGARELMARIAHPEVLKAITRHSPKDGRVREALTKAIVDGEPREGIALLEEALRSDGVSSLAKSLFAIGAYRPLLDRCRAYMLAQVRSDTPSPSILEMIGPGRGKMLRALLVFLGCQAAGGDPEQVLAGAAGIELVHTASLIHDDIMDDANTRRRLPALHETVGASRAIIGGDYLIAKAFRLLAESRATSPAPQVVEAFVVGAESGIRACAGQFQDVGAWTEDTLNEETYDQLIAGKTAAVIAGALTAGAVLVGGDGALVDTLSRYGETIGRAFQIRDDLLEFESVSADGCSMDRRPSLPLIHAFQCSDGMERMLIRRFLNGQEVIGSKIVELLKTTGSLTYAEAAANSLMEEAIRLAKRIPQVHEVLEALARYVVLRDH